MNRYNSLKFIFVAILLIFSSLVLLNYSVKSPNDGVLYISSAKHFIEHLELIDTVRSSEEIILPFPTTQLGIIIYLSILIYFFKYLWIFAYILFFSLIWTVLLKKI